MTNAPQHLNYNDIFVPSLVCDMVRDRCGSDIVSILDATGHAVRSATGSADFQLEYCTFGDDVALVVSSAFSGMTGQGTQSSARGDWVHIQYRVEGGGAEFVNDHSCLETPSGYCTVVRYPENSSIIRNYAASATWSAICIYVRPASFEAFFGIPSSAIPEHFAWMTDPDTRSANAHVFPICAASFQILKLLHYNQFQGPLRRVFIKAKIFELVAHLFNRLGEIGENRPQPLSHQEWLRVKNAEKIISSEMEHRSTLAEIAKQLGTNRSSLAAQFKQASGRSIGAKSRALRLQYAMELLTTQRLSVTEVSMRVGYSNISSFSRAFTQEFHMLPRDARRNAEVN